MENITEQKVSTQVHCEAFTRSYALVVVVVKNLSSTYSPSLKFLRRIVFLLDRHLVRLMLLQEG